jgi:hypothetical protein
VPANLSQGDMAAVSSDKSAIINETISRKFGDTVREIDHANVNDTEEPYENVSLNMYWDKNTGVALESLVSILTKQRIL